MICVCTYIGAPPMRMEAYSDVIKGLAYCRYILTYFGTLKISVLIDHIRTYGNPSIISTFTVIGMVVGANLQLLLG